MSADDPSVQTKTCSYQHIERMAASTCDGGRHINQDDFFMGRATEDVQLSKQDLEHIFNETNQVVKTKLKQYDTQDTGDDKESGCTALVGFVREKQIIIANAGDSRASLIYKKDDNYEIIHLTNEHCLNNQQETQRIDKEYQITATPPRLRAQPNDKSGIVPTRGLGAEAYAPRFSAEPEITTFDISNINLKNAFVISSTDGFWETLSDEEILQFFNQNDNNCKTLTEKANELRKKANDKEKSDKDNITVAIGGIHPGLIFGIFDGFGTFGHIAAQTAAKHMHINMHFKLDMAKITETLISDKKTWIEKMEIVQNFYEIWVSLPWWKEYQDIILFVACISIGAIIGGLFGGPLFIPGLIIGITKAAALEGAVMGLGCAGTCAGLYYGYSSYSLIHQKPDEVIRQIEKNVQLYPSV